MNENMNQRQRKIVENDLKSRIKRTKNDRKINIPNFLFWGLCVIDLFYILIITLNFLLISVGASESDSKNGETINYGLAVYLIPTIIFIFFGFYVYKAKTKWQVGNVFVFVWGAIWILSAIAPFVLNDNYSLVFPILICITSCINFILMFVLFYLIWKHKEIMKIQYYKNHYK